jgi:hypothetical protein
MTNLVETTNGIPYAFSQFRVLKQTVCSWSIVGTHSHVHACKCENPPQPVGPKVLAGSSIDTLEGMQFVKILQESRAHHAQIGKKVLLQHVDNGQLVMAMRFRQVSEISLETIFALEALNFGLHQGNVG